MAWIKRNLVFVIVMAVGLGLAGAAGYFVYSAAAANAEAKDQYNSALNDLTTLQQKKPFPSKANIEQANQDSAKVAQLAKDMGGTFVNFPTPPNLDAREFIEYLNTNLVAFRLMATNANVQLPMPEYAFSFQAEANELSFPTSNFGPWIGQLEEIKAMVEVLCEAKINSLDILQRAPVGGEDPTGQDYLPTQITSNQVAIISPYKIAFHGFSEEIAKVLSGFAESEHCILVRNIVVQASTGMPAYQPAGPGPMTYQPIPQYQYNQNNPYAGGGGRFGPRGPLRRPPPVIVQQQAQVAAAPATPAGPETILRPMPLFVTMSVDVVQLKNSR